MIKLNVESLSGITQKIAVFLSPTRFNSSSSVAVREAMLSRLKAANLTPTLIRIDFAVFPETSCQGLFNQIHKKATKKVPEALSCS